MVARISENTGICSHEGSKIGIETNNTSRPTSHEGGSFQKKCLITDMVLDER